MQHLQIIVRGAKVSAFIDKFDGVYYHLDDLVHLIGVGSDAVLNALLSDDFVARYGTAYRPSLQLVDGKQYCPVPLEYCYFAFWRAVSMGAPEALALIESIAFMPLGRRAIRRVCR